MIRTYRVNQKKRVVIFKGYLTLIINDEYDANDINDINDASDTNDVID